MTPLLMLLLPIALQREFHSILSKLGFVACLILFTLLPYRFCAYSISVSLFTKLKLLDGLGIFSANARHRAKRAVYQESVTAPLDCAYDADAEAIEEDDDDDMPDLLDASDSSDDDSIRKSILKVTFYVSDV